MEENLKSLIQLFNSDNKIKEILMKVAPPDFNSQDSVIEYSDQLMEAIEDITFEMDKILSQKIFNIPYDVKEAIKLNLKNIKQKIQGTLKSNDLKKIYEELFSFMSTELVKDIGKVCVGYKWKEHIYDDGHIVSLLDIAKNSKSINEMLHLLHSYVCNNDYILKSMPVIDNKNIGPYGDCTLFGLSNHVARDIFENMPTNSKECELGETYIVGLNGRVLMMVRDMGHALTIDIEEDKEKGTAFVKYFIPKICSPKKINKLKGINKVPITTKWRDLFASGMYEVPIEVLGSDMVNFINQVPTDKDMMNEIYMDEEKEITEESEKKEISQKPEEEIKDLANMDIREKITSSDEKKAKALLSKLLEKANKYLGK